MRIFYCLIIFSLFALTLRSQEIIEEPAPGSGIRVLGGVLVHRTYSNISEKVEVIDDFTRITRSPSDSVQKMMAGFTLGGEALLGKKEGFKGAFGFALGRTGAMYHYSFTEEGPSSRPGFTHMKRATELEHQETYWFADFHAGVRHHLVKKLFLTTMLVFTRPFLMKKETAGYVLTTYSVENSTDTESSVAFLNEPSARVKGQSNISFRFRVEYEFDAGQNKASVFFYRNLGLISTQPWWCIGGAYAF